MLSIGWCEIFVIVILGFLLFKPQEFPIFFRTIYKFYKLIVGYLNQLSSNFHTFAEEMEIEAIKNERSSAAHEAYKKEQLSNEILNKKKESKPNNIVQLPKKEALK